MISLGKLSNISIIRLNLGHIILIKEVIRIWVKLKLSFTLKEALGGGGKQ